MKALQVTEHFTVERAPIFIADPEGIFITQIASLLSHEFLPVILTRRVLVKHDIPQAIVIPYRSRVPKIPDNNFTDIYFIQGEEELSYDLFRVLLNEAKRRNIPFYFIAPRRFYTKKTAQQVLSFEKGKLFLYGDIVDDPSLINPAAYIVEQAREKQEIVVAGQGLSKIFPVSKQFVVDSIVRYSIVEKTENPCIVITPAGEMYELSLARILQQINSQLVLNFSHSKKTTQFAPDLPGGSIIVSESDASLRDAFRKELKVFREKNILKKSQRPTLPPVFRFFYLGLFCVVFFIALLLFLTGGMAFFGERLLVRSLWLMGEMRFSEAKQQAGFAKSAFVVSNSSVRLLTPAAHALLVEQSLRKLEKKLQTGEIGADLLSEAADGALVYQKLFMSKDEVKKKELVQATQHIKNSLLTISQLTAEGGLPVEYAKSLSENQKSIGLFLATTDILPDLLGFGKEKKYLLLFQNNNELRPGGGFIGSFAVLAIRNGKTEGVSIRDVYDADGQLKGHVEPPPALKKYLGVSHWYLRDSNFSPDFPESGANAAFFLNLETGEKVDGVIAIDTSVLEGLLRVLGPLRLEGSQKEVTAENVVELTQAEVEKDFFPGSTQKKDFLNELNRAIRIKVGLKSGLKEGLSLLQTISAGLAQKHILVTFVDPKLSYPFILQGISSTLKTHTKTSDWITDFFGVSEANVGTNKVNKYIARSFSYDVSVTETGEVKTQVTETLENKSGKGTPYGGEYMAYFRFLLPENVSPEELMIDGVKQVVLSPLENPQSRAERGSVAANILEVERIDIKGKSTYGFFLTVPVQSKKTIFVKYTQRSEKNNPVGKYALTLFKQPGTGSDPYVFSLSLPADYALLSSSVPLKKEGSLYKHISRLGTDQEIRLSYGKK